jgi:small multidrug resistance pump
LGTALVAVLGFLIFKENISPLKIVSILWIILGVVGLNLNMKLH